MDRTAVKKFAIEARRILLQQVAAQTERLGITIDRITEPQTVSGGLNIPGITLDTIESHQYQQLRRRLQDLQSQEKTLKGAVTALIDEVAYTWFNRLAALRFMEVNGYLKRRVLSSSDPKLVDPDLLRDASDIAELEDLPGLNRSIWLEWRGLAAKAPNPEEFLYRRLLGLQCQELAVGLPFLFTEKYPALLMPGNLLNQDSIVRKLVADIAEVDWLDTPDSENGVEIVGWLYQFYISERKDAVIGAKSKVAARDIPAATQLFTPHWIVRYMVENSLGRLWLESQLREQMPYYLPPLSQWERGGEGLPQRPEELTVIDPACGSGHILVYAFDLLFEIYKEQGYLERDIPALILTHNLHGLDIDDRAVQLASFAVLMKARAKNPKILRKPPQLKILTVRSTRHLSISHFTIDRPQVQAAPIIDYQLTLDSIVGSPRQLPLIQPPTPTLPPAYPLLEQLLATFAEADNLGSLITPDGLDAVKLSAQLDEIAADMPVFASEVATLREIVRQAELLSQKYWVVVANPPYMGSKGMNSTLKEFAEKNYPASKSDLFAVSVERIMDFALKGGFIGLMTPFTWMFLSSYEKLRKRIINENTLTSLIRPEYHAFFDSAFVPICTFTLSTHALPEYRGTFVDLKDFYGSELQPVKVLEAIANPDCAYLYYAKAVDFAKIPGSPIAYWISDCIKRIFLHGKQLGDIASPRKGNSTTCNDRFLRFWSEVDFSTVALEYKDSVSVNSDDKKWIPYNKGGGFRKWYGFNEFLINWKNQGEEIKSIPHSVIANESYFMKPGWTWSTITSSKFSIRKFGDGFVFDNGGCCIFSDAKLGNLLGGLLNSKVFSYIFGNLNPTLNFQSGEVAKFPVIVPEKELEKLILDAISTSVNISIEDWNKSETSWGFTVSPFFTHKSNSLHDIFENWHQQSETAFAELKRLEEENNRYWIEAYGLQAELSPEVPDEQITIRRADLARDIRSLISYAVGCMMGRYSLDTPGLIHAGQPFDPSRHHTFPAAGDGILPITDPAYFDDDIVSRFVEFVKIAYSPDTLTENLDFIATALELKPGQTARERIRSYFLTEFISDHIKTYKKRPIYWLFTSGKAGSRRGAAFGALVYLHRYTPATVARLRTDYVLELQLKLDQEIQQNQQQQDTSTTTAAKKAAAKQLKTRQDQQTELRDYQAKLQTVADSRIELDLDDGVAYNYTRFKGLVYEGSDLKMVDLEAKAQWKIDLLERDRKLLPESAE